MIETAISRIRSFTERTVGVGPKDVARAEALVARTADRRAPDRAFLSQGKMCASNREIHGRW